MKRIYFLIILLPFTQLSLGQDLSQLNGFKYGIIEDIVYEGSSIKDLEFKEMISESLSEFGIKPLYKNDILPSDLKENPCLGIIITNFLSRGGNGNTPAYFSKLNFVDCREKIVMVIELRHQSKYKGALSKTLSKLKPNKYIFNPELTPKKNMQK